jgi:hypothetical protein
MDMKARADAHSKMRTEYERAKIELAETDVSPAMVILFSYSKGDPPEAAVYVLAQCQMILARYRALTHMVTAYEREHDLLARLG